MRHRLQKCLLFVPRFPHRCNEIVPIPPGRLDSYKYILPHCRMFKAQTICIPGVDGTYMNITQVPSQRRDLAIQATNLERVAITQEMRGKQVQQGKKLIYDIYITHHEVLSSCHIINKNSIKGSIPRGKIVYCFSINVFSFATVRGQCYLNALIFFNLSRKL